MQRLEFAWCSNVPTLCRAAGQISEVVVHRIAVSQEDPAFQDTPQEVARFFAEHPIGVAATGGAMPYPLLVGPSGALVQTLALRLIAPHARAHNCQALGLGVIGDFRHQPPPPRQYAAVVQMCAAVLQCFGLSPAALMAHDVLLEGTADPNKICPGAHLPMDTLRRDVARARHHGACFLDFAW